MKDEDTKRNTDWRVLLMEICIQQRCVPTDVEVRIGADVHGPVYRLYINGEHRGDTNAASMLAGIR